MGLGFDERGSFDPFVVEKSLRRAWDCDKLMTRINAPCTSGAMIFGPECEKDHILKAQLSAVFARGIPFPAAAVRIGYNVLGRERA